MTASTASTPARLRAAFAVLFFVLFCGPSIRAQLQSPVTLPPGVTYVTSVEGIDEYHLQNGLRVLLFADPTKANVTVNITYMVGSRHEDYGETGMAHLLEHLVFKGTPGHPDIPKELKDHGARPNGTTWVDRTNYFETFQASDENLAWALSLEADRMINSFIAKKDLDSEMSVVRNEYEAGENSPPRVLNERTMSTAFLWHNYGKSTIGARSDIERVPIERLQAFYHHFYQPDNSVLVVAGKIDEAKTLALVDRTFSPIPKPARVVRKTYTAEPTQDGERTVTLRRVGDVQALEVMYHVSAGTHAEFPAAQMAALILGTVPSGRLHKALVEPGLAVSSSAFAYQLMEPGVMSASATLRKEQSLDAALAATLGVTENLKNNPFTDEELNRAKTQWLKNVDLMMNDSEQIALGLTTWQAMGDWRMLFLHRDRVKQVTLAQVQQAAEKYFIASNRTVGKFIPDAAPQRADVPDPPDVVALLKDYRGGTTVAKGEAFDASPENIDKQTLRIDLPGGLKLSFLPKKTRGAQVNAQISLRFGDENSLKGMTVAGTGAGALLMRGSSHHTRQQIRDEFDRLKAQVSVNGGMGGASARIEVAQENFAAVLALVAEILKEPAFPESEFAQLKQQALAALEAQKSDPAAIASLALARHMSPYPKGDVRYVYSLAERIEETQAATLEQVKAFHHDFYGASNGEVTVIGDFDPAAVQKQLGELFDSWKSPKPHARITQKFSPIAPLAEAIETPDKANANWNAGLAIRMNDADPDYPALVLGNYILGSGMGSRLFTRIRGKEGLSYGVGAGFSAPIIDDAARFSASAICAPQNASKVEASFKDELGKILAEGYRPEEVEAAKKSWFQSRQVSRANDAELVGRLASNRYWGRTMAYDSDLEKKVAALTPEQIQTAMKKCLDLSQLSIVRAGDFKKAGVTW